MPQLKFDLIVDDKGTPVVKGFGGAAEQSFGLAARAASTMAGNIAIMVTGGAGIAALTSQFRAGLEAVERFNLQVASLSGFITTFSQTAANGDLAAGFAEALAYSRELIPALEVMDAKTIAAGKDLATMVETMAMYGVVLDLNNDRQRQGFLNLANALKLVTAGQNQDVQMRQEINALLMGQIRMTDRLPKLLAAIDPQLAEHLKLWRQQGTLIENVGELLKGFGASTELLEHTWEAVGSSMRTIVDRTMRGGMQPAYDDLLALAVDFNRALMDTDGTLTPLAQHLQEGIQDAVMRMEDLAEASKNAAAGVGLVLGEVRELVGFKDVSIPELGIVGYMLFGKSPLAKMILGMGVLFDYTNRIASLAGAHAGGLFGDIGLADLNRRDSIELKKLLDNFLEAGPGTEAENKFQVFVKQLELARAEDKPWYLFEVFGRQSDEQKSRIAELRAELATLQNFMPGAGGIQTAAGGPPAMVSPPGLAEGKLEPLPHLFEQAQAAADRLAKFGLDPLQTKIARVQDKFAKAHQDLALYFATGQAGAATLAEQQQAHAKLTAMMESEIGTINRLETAKKAAASQALFNEVSLAALPEHARQLEEINRQYDGLQDKLTDAAFGKGLDLSEYEKLWADLEARRQEALAGAAGQNFQELVTIEDKLFDDAASQVQDFAATMADTFGAVGEAIGGMTAALAEYGRTMHQIGRQKDLSLKLAGDDPAKQAAAWEKFHKDNAKASIASYGDMTAAAQSFFDEGSSGYETMDKATKAFRAVEMALAAESMVKNLAATGAQVMAWVTGETAKTGASVASVAPQVAANMAKGTGAAISAVANAANAPWPIGFASAAAMAALMAGLGFAVMGGGGGGGEAEAAGPPPVKLTGTVFGDTEAKSESIANALELLKDNSDLDLAYTGEMLSVLRDINANLAGFGNLLIRTFDVNLPEGAKADGFESVFGNNLNKAADPLGVGQAVGDFSNLQFGVNFDSPLGELGDIFSGKWATDLINDWVSGLFGTSSAAGAHGIVFPDQKLADIINQGFLDSLAYVDVHKKKSIFGHVTDRWIETQTAPLDDQIKRQFGLVFGGLVDAVAVAADILGVEADDFEQRLNDFVLAAGKINLKDLTGAETQELLQNLFSGWGDQIAEALLDPDMLAGFEQVGEGYFETMIRVASGVEQAQAAMERLGIEMADWTDIVNKQGNVFAELSRQSILDVEKLFSFEGNAVPASAFGGSIQDFAKAIFPDMEYVLRAPGDNMSVYDPTSGQMVGSVDSGQHSFSGKPSDVEDTFYYYTFGGGGASDKAAANILLSSFTGVGEIINQIDASGEDLIALYHGLLDIRGLMRAAALDDMALGMDMITGAGGVGALTAGLESYGENYFTDQEKLAASSLELDRSFGLLGVSVPKTREEFRALIEAQDLTTVAGAKLAGALFNLAEPLDDLISQIDDLAAAAKDANAEALEIIARHDPALAAKLEVQNIDTYRSTAIADQDAALAAGAIDQATYDEHIANIDAAAGWLFTEFLDGLKETAEATKNIFTDLQADLAFSDLAPGRSVEQYYVEYERRKAAVAADPTDQAAAQDFAAYAKNNFLPFLKETSANYDAEFKGVQADISRFELAAEVGTEISNAADIWQPIVEAINLLPASLQALLLPEVFENLPDNTGIETYQAIADTIRQQPIEQQYDLWAELWREIGKPATAFIAGLKREVQIAAHQSWVDAGGVGEYPGLAYAAGGLATSASIFGEAGPEWAVPTVSPHRESFLRNLNLSPVSIAHEIMAALPSFQAPALATLPPIYIEQPEPPPTLPPSVFNSSAPPPAYFDTLPRLPPLGSSQPADSNQPALDPEQVKKAVYKAVRDAIADSGDRPIEIHVHLDGRELGNAMAGQALTNDQFSNAIVRAVARAQ